MAVASENEMIRKYDYEAEQEAKKPERFTSLQPTYEDTVQPDPENDWLDE